VGHARETTSSEAFDLSGNRAFVHFEQDGHVLLSLNSEHAIACLLLRYTGNGGACKPPSSNIGSHYQSRVHTPFRLFQAAIEWLYTSQDVGQADGSAAAYNLVLGWQRSYPETTGYIIPTLYEYSQLTNEGRGESLDVA
jgi:hypothetical protein